MIFEDSEEITGVIIIVCCRHTPAHVCTLTFASSEELSSRKCLLCRPRKETQQTDWPQQWYDSVETNSYGIFLYKHLIKLVTAMNSYQCVWVGGHVSLCG